ncbi:hypothetical protein GBA52_028911 [Prunus armeniaca]|nr:hypothetical protein GBA52_028911 [Prunus armeniaca]
MHSWWESISRTRSRIHSLSSLLPLLSPPVSPPSPTPILPCPLPSVLSLESYDADPTPLCHWLYDTFLSSDPPSTTRRFSFLPCPLWPLPLPGPFSLLTLLSSFPRRLRSCSPRPLRRRDQGSKQQACCRFDPRSLSPLSTTPLEFTSPTPRCRHFPHQSIGVLSPPLEPQIAVKSTKRACIVGVALDSYYKHISQMPTWSKIDFCRFLASWAGQDCHCLHQVGDDDTNEPDITPALFLESGNEIDDVTEEMDQLMRFEEKNVCNGVVLESKGQ